MRRAYVIVGLGFGDEGKGNITDALVRRAGASLVVRFNGGAQAAHHVVDGGNWHCFSTWGSGTLAGAQTHLGEHVVVDPVAAVPEADRLRALGVEDPYAWLLVHPRCRVATAYHKLASRAMEVARGEHRHGSTGMGIGEVERLSHSRHATLRAEDLHVPAELRHKVRTIRDQLLGRMAALADEIPSPDDVADGLLDAGARIKRLGTPDWAQHEAVVFEGAQGVLLDQDHGFWPHTTWSNATADGALAMVPAGTPTTVVGVLRTFATRHGRGPFPTELRGPGSARWREGEHNGAGPWQEAFRVGHFDLVLARYAVQALGHVDALALTCVDKVAPGPWRASIAYDHPLGWRVTALHPHRARSTEERERLTGHLRDVRPVLVEVKPSEVVEWVQQNVGVPVGVVSEGPSAGFVNMGRLIRPDLLAGVRA